MGSSLFAKLLLVGAVAAGGVAAGAQEKKTDPQAKPSESKQTQAKATSTEKADAKSEKKSETKRPVEQALPASVDLREQFKEYGLGPRRQGKRGTCSVFTTAAAFEFALAKATGKGQVLSPEYMNWATNQLINNNRDRGQFFHNLLDAFNEYGVCTEEEMPYTKEFDPALAPSESVIESAKQAKNKGFKIHWITRWGSKQGLTPFRMYLVKRVLANGYPVAAGSDHSRLLVGYVDDPKQPGGGYFLTKDSGLGRFSVVSYEFAKQKINDTYWVEVKSETASAGTEAAAE